jgi:hypothetical protein
VRRGAWLFADVVALGLWLLVLLADALFFLVSYTQPADSYTGQDWDRAMSWVLLGILVAASALAFAVVRLPVTYRCLRISARSNSQGLTGLLASQQPWRLARILMTFNTPIMIVMAAVAAYAAVATSHQPSAPAGTLLWAAAAGVIIAASITTLEVFLLRRLRQDPGPADNGQART